MSQTQSPREYYPEITRERAPSDWKHDFKDNPAAMLAVAFGGGIAVGAMIVGRTRHHDLGSGALGSSTTSRLDTDTRGHKAQEIWGDVKAALIGVGARHFKDFIGELVPGFKEEFRRLEEKGPKSAAK